MVTIGLALQRRMLDSASRHLGPTAGGFVRDVCVRQLNTPFEGIEYHQLTALLKAIQADAGPLLGQSASDALAADVIQLLTDVDAGIPGRVIGNVSRVMGPSADPFLRAVCGKLNIELDIIDRTTLPMIADAARVDALPLLGEEAARAVQTAVARSANSRPAVMAAQIVAAARRHAGPAGETFVRELCRTRFACDLDQIEPDGLEPLAHAIRTEGASVIGTAGAIAFGRAIAGALTSPDDGVRAKVVEIARQYVGPAAEEFLRRGCRKQGMPWEGVDYEHMMWLAEVVRAESASLIGKQSADDFARAVRRLLVGGK